MMSHLSQYRDSIPKAVNQGVTFKQIATNVIDNMTTHGYDQPIPSMLAKSWGTAL